MFHLTFVKPAFHMAWFILILGGASLFEVNGWNVAGVPMLLYGVFMLIYTGMAIYLNKQIIKKPAPLLVIALGFILILLVAHVLLGHYVVSMILAVLAIPVILGYFKVKKNA